MGRRWSQATSGWGDARRAGRCPTRVGGGMTPEEAPDTGRGGVGTLRAVCMCGRRGLVRARKAIERARWGSERAGRAN
eukprot:scaffold34602_cov185-Isochrysis_galbana.AAC.2